VNFIAEIDLLRIDLYYVHMCVMYESVRYLNLKAVWVQVICQRFSFSITIH